MKKYGITALLAVALVLAVTEARRSEGEAQTETAATRTFHTSTASSPAPTDGQESWQQDTEGLEIPHYVSDRGGQLIRHTGFTLSYDADFKTPQWVAWQLTAEEAAGEEPRADSFAPDPEVRGAKAYPQDYTNSGYDRGHMAPAGDMKWSRQAMQESFYMTNICPQNRNLNRGDWKDLEELERTWATRYGTVYIVAGPMYTRKNPPRIGNHKVAVPDCFFKVLLVAGDTEPQAYAFVFRNEAGSRPLKSYQHTVDEVERLTGIDFFPALPDELEARVEAALNLVN
ncbi:MAG: DNA/RNA non-specific endonuclease [Alloprevotella sp.]